MAQVAVDTPDYQRGVVSAQKLLGVAANGDTAITVGVPPNVETLVAAAPGAVPYIGCKCVGKQSGNSYPGVQIAPTRGGGPNLAWYFDVSAALDNEVTVTWEVAPAGGFSIYGDTGVHLLYNPSALTTFAGVLYVAPSAPPIIAGDHPPVELISGEGEFSGNATVIGAPKDGQRLRVFHVTAGIFSGSGFCTVSPGSAGGALIVFGDGAAVSHSYAPTGVALTEATALTTAQAQSGTSWFVNVTYTIETI